MSIVKNRRRKKKDLEVDITSLLDILVILLVFLLKSYNASDLKLSLKDGIDLPESKSNILGQHSVIVQVNRNQEIWVNQKKVGLVGSSEKIESLYQELKMLRDKKKERSISSTETIAASNPDKKKKNDDRDKQVNIVLDKDLNYDVMKKVMHTSALAGHSKFKFIVMGKFQ